MVRGSIDARSFVAFWLRDGRVVAVMNSTDLKVAKATERLIRSEAQVDPARLTDPDVQLEALAPASPSE